jgi:hypothetical protein
LWLREPLVPVTRTENVPVEAKELAVIVKGALAGLPGRGVTGEATDKVSPDGAVPSHDVDNVTAELKPFKEFTVIVVDPIPPCVNETVEVEEAIEKSARAEVVV